jgi:O-antigen/teichoic acid export membrane protein
MSGVKWTGVATTLKAAVQLIQVAIVARLLDPSDFGLVAMASVAIAFGTAFADAGVSNAIFHFQETDRNTLSSLYWMTVLAGCTIFAVVNAGAPLIVALYDEPRLAGILFAFSFVFIVSSLGQQYQVLLQKDLRFRSLALRDMGSSIVGLLVTVVSAYRGAGAYALVLGQLAAATTGTVLLISLGSRTWRPLMHFSVDDLRRYLAFGAFQTGEKGLGLLSREIDRLTIGVLLGAEALGYYQIAHQLLMTPYRLAGPVLSRVAFPLLAKLQRDNGRLSSVYLQIVAGISLATFPIYAIMLAIPDLVVEVLFGVNWTRSADAFQILGFVGFFYATAHPTGSLLVAKGRADIGFYANLGRSALMLLGIAIGSRYGLEGVAIAVLAVTAGVMFPFWFYVRWRLVQMRPREFLLNLRGAASGSFLAGAALWVLAHGWPTDAGGAELAVLGVLGVLVYIGTLAVLDRKQLLLLLRIVRP